MKIRSWNLLLLAAFGGLVAGCNPMVETGKPLLFPKKDAKLFGVTSFAEAAITNQNGIPIAGVILHDASLIETPEELSRSKHKQYVIFEGFMLGEGAKSRYWQQQSEKRIGLGLPDMDTRLSKVLLIHVDPDRVVISCKTMQAAHVTISVDTNDFSRTFKP